MSRELQIATEGVSVLFTPWGDRFTQRIEIAGAVLTSVDEDASYSERWPPSPPLQEVHLEERPGGQQLALMIGRAGTSHWSISCELDPATAELRFDVACRIKEPAEWLGSTYQLSQGISYQGDSSQGELLDGDRPICAIKTESDCEIVWNSDARRLVFRPKEIGEKSGESAGEILPSTIRWRYMVLVAPTTA